jgi:hypothetical protein
MNTPILSLAKDFANLVGANHGLIAAKHCARGAVKLHPRALAKKQKMFELVLMRHGESVWNSENKFAGWSDVGLSPTGIAEVPLAVCYRIFFVFSL